MDHTRAVATLGINYGFVDAYICGYSRDTFLNNAARQITPGITRTPHGHERIAFEFYGTKILLHMPGDAFTILSSTGRSAHAMNFQGQVFTRAS